jgi:hypothetical protein
MPETTELDPDRVRPFADFLRETAQGKTHEELSEALRDLVGRVLDTGKKGSLGLTIVVEPMKGGGEQLLVSDEIRLKLPEHDRAAAVFFADRDHNLVRNDPRQMSFESLREVPAHDPATGELRNAQ